MGRFVALVRWLRYRSYEALDVVEFMATPSMWRGDNRWLALLLWGAVVAFSTVAARGVFA